MRLAQRTASPTEHRNLADTTRLLVIGSLLTVATVVISTVVMAWLIVGVGARPLAVVGLAVPLVFWLSTFVVVRLYAPRYAIFVTLALPLLMVAVILVLGYVTFGGMHA